MQSPNSFWRKLASIVILFAILLPPAGGMAAKNTSAATANVIVTGDVMCLAGQLSAAKTSKGWNFKPVFSLVKPIFDKADYVVGNLETVVAGAKAGVTQFNQKGNPKINAPVEFADALKYAGFDFMVTANNHSMDKGESGLKATLKTLDKRGIKHAGTYASKNQRNKTPIVTVKGIKIAVLGYTQFINSGTPSIPKAKRGYLVNRMDLNTIKKDIAAVKKRGAEFVIVYAHWGNENTTRLTSFQKSAAKSIAKAGADAVIGSHPHVVQKMEYVKVGKKKVLVAYSLGNLVSSMARNTNKDSLLLNLQIKRDKKGKVTLNKATYLCTTTANNGSKRWCILPSRLCMQQSKFSKLKSTLSASAKRTKKVAGSKVSEVTRFPYM